MSDIDEDMLFQPETKTHQVYKRKLSKKQFPLNIMGQLWVDDLWQPSIPMTLTWKEGILYNNITFNQWTKTHHAYTSKQGSKLRINSILSKKQETPITDRINTLVLELIHTNQELTNLWLTTTYQTRLNQLLQKSPTKSKPNKSYTLFFNKQKEEEQLTHPDLVGEKLEKHMQTKWKNLDKKEKEFWKKLSRPTPPEIIRNGLVVFANEMKQQIEQQNPDWSNTLVLAELKRRWDSLDASSKKKYNQ